MGPVPCFNDSEARTMGFGGKKRKGHGKGFSNCLGVVLVAIFILSAPFQAKADPPTYNSEPPAQATVKGTGLRIRATPSLTANVVGQYKGGETVYILSTSPFTTTVGDKTDVWYLVLDGEGRFGWVFGGFLEIKNGEPPGLIPFIEWVGQHQFRWQALEESSFPAYPSLSSMDSSTKKLAIAYLAEGLMRGAPGLPYFMQFGLDGEMAVPALIYQSQFLDRNPPFFEQPGVAFGDDYEGFYSDPLKDYLTTLNELTTDRAKVLALARQQRQNGIYENPTNLPNLLALLGATDLSADIQDLKKWFLTSTVEDLDKGVFALKGAMKDDPAGFAVCMREALETKKIPQERAGAFGFSLEGVDVRVGREGLVGLLKKSDELSIIRAMEAIGKIMPDERAMGPLLSLHDKPPFVLPVLQCLTVRNLPDNAVKAVITHGNDNDRTIRYQATQALSKNVNGLSVPALKSRLADGDDEIRWLAEDALLREVPENEFIVHNAWKNLILNQKGKWNKVVSVSPDGVIRSTDTLVIVLRKGTLGRSEWVLSSDRKRDYHSPHLTISDVANRKRIPQADREIWSVSMADVFKWSPQIFEDGAGLYVIKEDGDDGDRIFFEYAP